jgi:hypothetical protein
VPKSIFNQLKPIIDIDDFEPYNMHMFSAAITSTYCMSGAVWQAEFCARNGVFLCLVISRVELISKDNEKFRLMENRRYCLTQVDQFPQIFLAKT